MPFYEVEAEHGGDRKSKEFQAYIRDYVETATSFVAEPKYDSNVWIADTKNGRLKGYASDFAAKDFDVARGYVTDAKAIKEEEPETFEEVKAGKIKLSQAIKERKKKKQLQHLHELQPVQGKFNVLVVDPPWPSPGDLD